MAKTDYIELGKEIRIPILYEDRAVLAIDKPPGWMLSPYSWERTSRNLQRAISSSVAGRDFWARSRNIKFLRYIHRLDAETTGVLLFAKSPGALQTIGRLFEARRVEKRYLAVARSFFFRESWICNLNIAPDPEEHGRMITHAKKGKEAETSFQVIARKNDLALLEARPVTGRTHQIRVHLQAAKASILNDPLYGPPQDRPEKTSEMALRAWQLQYQDPFTRRQVHIQAPATEFLQKYGFGPLALGSL